MKIYNCVKGLSKPALNEINRILRTHDLYKNYSSFSPCRTRYSRRRNEEHFKAENPDVVFYTKDGRLTVAMFYSESYGTVYYHLSVVLNGFSKDIRAVSKLLKEIHGF